MSALLLVQQGLSNKNTSRSGHPFLTNDYKCKVDKLLKRKGQNCSKGRKKVQPVNLTRLKIHFPRGRQPWARRELRRGLERIRRRTWSVDRRPTPTTTSRRRRRWCRRRRGSGGCRAEERFSSFPAETTSSRAIWDCEGSDKIRPTDAFRSLSGMQRCSGKWYILLFRALPRCSLIKPNLNLADQYSTRPRSWRMLLWIQSRGFAP